MPPSVTTSILIIAAIGLTIGFIVGWFATTLRGDKQTADPTQRISTNADAPTDSRLLLRIWRNIKDGSLLYELRGSLLPRADQLNLEERRELVDLMKETSSWLGIPTEAASLPSRSPAGSGANSSVSSAHLPGSLETSEPILQPPSLIGGMANVIADVVSPQQAVKRDEPKSIVQQIDEIFQAKLLGTPYEGQRIYISEDTRKGVIVWIGSAMYEGVGSVPEGDVKKLLRASVQEWERIQEQVRRSKGV